jgi:hypothetical protein
MNAVADRFLRRNAISLAQLLMRAAGWMTNQAKSADTPIRDQSFSNCGNWLVFINIDLGKIAPRNDRKIDDLHSARWHD